MISSLAASDLNTTIAFEQYNNISNFSNNSVNGSSYDIVSVFPTYIRTTSTVLCSLIMGIGVLGNIMVPIVIFKSKDMRNSTNVFLMNLSIADLMVLLVCTPTVLVEVNSQPETWVLGEEMCKAVPFIEMMVTHASVLTILAISFERYYAICKPLKAGYICTKARAFFICLCAWALAALLTSPMILISEHQIVQYNDGSWVPFCLTYPNTIWREIFFYLSICVFYWVPLVILLVLYSVIAIHLMADPGIMGNETFNYRARSQLVLMLGTVVLLFFLCLMPFRIFLLWFISSDNLTIKSLGVEKYFNILYFCRIMSYVHSALNPILYNLMSSKFRDGFMKICGLRTGRFLLRRRRRWGFTNSLNTTTTSLSYSSTRRDRDHFTSSHYHYRGSPDIIFASKFYRNSKDYCDARILSREASRRDFMSSPRNSKTNEDFSPILKHISRKNTMCSDASDSPSKMSPKNSLEKLHKESSESLLENHKQASSSESESPKLSQYGDLSNCSTSQPDEGHLRLSLALSEYDNIEKSTQSLIEPDGLVGNYESRGENSKSKSIEDVLNLKTNKNPPDRGKLERENLDNKLVPNSIHMSKVVDEEVPDTEEVSLSKFSDKADRHPVRNDSIRRSILKSKIHQKLSSDRLIDNVPGQVSNGSVGKSKENFKNSDLIKCPQNMLQKRHPESHV